MSSSSNPFRKSATHQPENRFSPMPFLDAAQLFPPPTTTFRDENVPPAAAQNPVVDTNKAKVVKKVRVLSPPPRTPESPEWTTSYFGSVTAPAYVPEQDPFDSVDNDWDDGSAAVAAAPPSEPAVPPVRSPLTAVDMQRPVNAVPNPFSKKKTDEAANLRDAKGDAREEGEASKAAQSARRSLNVDSFKRLLMTGATSPPSSPLPTDSFEHEPADRPRPASMPPPPREASTAVSAHKEKKAPPPPPSSRHGKVIKPVPVQIPTGTEHAVTSPKEAPADPVAHQKEPSRPPLSRESSAGSGSSASSSSASEEDEIVEMDTHPAALTASPDQIDVAAPPPTSNAKKPVPVPPPRRQPRVEAKTSGTDVHENDPPPRTSMDSISSRSNSVRHSANAPAPPPPRRTTSGSKQPAAPHSSTHIHPPDQDTPRTSSESASRPMAPPPPPTRNPSARRPQSLYGLESSHRRVMAEIKPRDVVAPPPPPLRIRGSSQSSADGPSTRASLDSARKPRSSADGFGDLEDAQYTGQSVDILADLESLQREVDALRGRMS